MGREASLARMEKVVTQGLSERWSKQDAKAIFDRLRSAAAYYATRPDIDLEEAGQTRQETDDWARRLFDAADVINEVWVKRMPEDA
jgi:hypothetical protein